MFNLRDDGNAAFPYGKHAVAARGRIVTRARSRRMLRCTMLRPCDTRTRICDRNMVNLQKW
jgi:hypothetical protein